MYFIARLDEVQRGFMVQRSKAFLLRTQYTLWYMFKSTLSKYEYELKVAQVCLLLNEDDPYTFASSPKSIHTTVYTI